MPNGQGTNYTTLSVSLATTGTTDDPPNFPDWPDMQVGYIDNNVLVQNARAHYQFTFTDVPDFMIHPRAVHMAFRDKDVGGPWTIVSQSSHGERTSPFWVTRWPTPRDELPEEPGPESDLGLNDVPVHGIHNGSAYYQVVLVVEYNKSNGTIHHAMVDPEIHNEPAA